MYFSTTKISIVISIISLIVSLTVAIFSIYKFRKFDKELKIQQKKLNDFQIAKNEEDIENNKKAVLVCKSIISNESGKFDLFEIKNIGKSDAFSVKFKITKGEGIIIAGCNEFEKIPPYQSVTIPFQTYMGSDNNGIIKLTWKDDFKDNESMETSITF